MSAPDDDDAQAETLAYITEGEAEFWTNISARKSKTLEPFSPTQESPSTVTSPDGLHFKFDGGLSKSTEDHLSILYHQGLEKNAKEIEENVEKKRLSEIFEFNENSRLNENMPGISMNFLDGLFNQLDQSSSKQLDDAGDEEFTEIDESEITAVINNNTDIDKSLNTDKKLENDKTVIGSIVSFFEELGEETDVIRGTIDEHTLLRRRSTRAKFVIP